MEGGEAGGDDDGAGVVVVAGGSGDAGGVGALEALGAVLVAAEDSGGADGGSLSLAAGEEGLRERVTTFSEGFMAARPSPPAPLPALRGRGVNRCKGQD